MEVILAEHAGFCFGVNRAVDTLKEEIRQYGDDVPIYTWGPIIHNEEVVRSFEEQGVRAVETIGELQTLADTAQGKEPGIVVIRSHGVSRDVMQGITELGFRVVDATCPFVKRIHQIVEKAGEEDRIVIVVGDPGHPEVQGIVGWSAGEGAVRVVADAEAAEELDLPRTSRVTIVSQTTYRVTKFQEIVEIIKQKEYDVNIADTICNATEERQREAEALAASVDAMIVVGGAHSSNTRKLYEICARLCPRTDFVHTPEDLRLTWPSSVQRVGITAGASTPQKIIEEVVNYVRGQQEFH